MGQVSLPWNSFNCGELSPLLEGRSDMPQYMKGGKVMLNFLPTIQGPAMRRGGLRYCGTTPNGLQSALVMRFSRSATESYVLVFGDRILQFYYNGARVELSPGVPYQLATPYPVSALYNADGTPALVGAESADVVYLAGGGYRPQVLSFFGANNWTLTDFVATGGPWQDGNANESIKVYVTGSVTVGSTVTLRSTGGGIWNANMVGGLMRIHQQDLTTLKPWQPGQQTPNCDVGVLRRSGFCTYKCVNSSAGTPPSGGVTRLFTQTGGVTLTHTSGNAWDGDQTTTIDPIGGSTYYSTGMEWAYQDCGYGVVRITGFTSDTQVQATVLTQLPAAVVGIGGATNNWELGAWSDDQGYPTQVTFFRQRLTFAGGAGNRNRVWCSVVGDYANFEDLYFGEALQDSAITVACQSDQVNNIVYLSPADTLLVGSSGGEFIIGPQSISDPFGPLNIQVSPQSAYGGRNVVPIRVNQYALFVTKSGRNLRESTFAFTAGPTGNYVSNDLSVLSEHIPRTGIINMVWARNPYTCIWMVMGDRSLASFIYNPEQEVRNWERHDIGGQGKVLSLAVIPSADGSVDDVYAVTQRQTNFFGSITTIYSIEKIEQPYQPPYPQVPPGADQQFAFYVDAGLTLDNAISATLQPGPGYLVVGSTDVSFVAGSGVFVGTDVGREIHFDWETTAVGEDGLTYPMLTTAIAKITEYVNTTTVLGTILTQWPNRMGVLIPAGDWRMTVTSIFSSSIPTIWQGQTLSFLMDGAPAPDQVYPASGGDITLSRPASYIQCGIKSPAQFTSMLMDQGDRTGSGIGKLKDIVRATLRLFSTLGGKFGRDIDHLEQLEQQQAYYPNDDAPQVYTGDSQRLTFTDNVDGLRQQRICVRQDQPLPMTLVAVGVLANVEEDS